MHCKKSSIPHLHLMEHLSDTDWPSLTVVDCRWLTTLGGFDMLLFPSVVLALSIARVHRKQCY